MYFQVNSNGWYTWNGKLVLASATKYLFNYGWSYKEGITYYKYYDEVVITIDGVDYPGVILDSCGACMKSRKIDLFVTSKQTVKDTKVTVRKS